VYVQEDCFLPSFDSMFEIRAERKERMRSELVGHLTKY